jgi:hypothetical protein
MAARSGPAYDDGGSPRLLIVFAASVLCLVAGIALIGLTDSDWAVVLALALTLMLLCVALRDVLVSMREPAGPPPSGDSAVAAHDRVLLLTWEPLDDAQLGEILDGGSRSVSVLVVVPARGAVDPPLIAIEGALRYFEADRIVIAGRCPELAARVRRRFGLPVRELDSPGPIATHPER